MENLLNKYSDEELIGLMKSEPKVFEEIFSALYDKYSSKLHAYALCMLNDKSMADDAVQEVYTALYRYIRDEKYIINIKAFLFGIIKNYCFRSNRDRKNNVQLDEINLMKHSTEQHHNGELYELILKSLPLIEDIYREAYTMREVNGMDYEEIAMLMNITPAGARTRVARAISKLKEVLLPVIKEIEKFN